MEMHPHRHHYRLIILALFAGLCVIVIALVFYYQRAGMLDTPEAAISQEPSATDESSPITVNKYVTSARTPTGVVFDLEPQSGLPSYPANMPLTLDITLDSNTHPVLGYDIILSRDPSLYDVVSVTSAKPDYTVLKFVKQDRLTITGVFKPGTKKAVALDGDTVVTVVIRPKQAGTLDLTVRESKGQETTKVMTPGEGKTLVKLPIDSPKTLSIDID